MEDVWLVERITADGSPVERERRGGAEAFYSKVIRSVDRPPKTCQGLFRLRTLRLAED